MIKTIKDLKSIILLIPDDIEIGFCSYAGGHIFEIGDSYLEANLDGGNPTFILYTKPGEEAVLKKGGK